MSERHLTAESVLRQLGFSLPGRLTADVLGGGDNLAAIVSSLVAAWQRTRDRSKSLRRKSAAEHQLELLMHCERHVAESWVEEDSRIPLLARDWLKPRRWWWSGTVPATRRVAIISSRLPKRLDPKGTWLQALRAALAHVREQNKILVVGHGTAGHDLILRGAVRHEIPTLLLRCCNEASNENWAAHWSSHLQEPPSHHVFEGWALPAHHEAEESDDDSRTKLRTIPERDRAVIAWADEVIVLGLRPRGNLEALIRRRLELQPGSVFLADLPGLQPAKLRAELLGSGATTWPVKVGPDIHCADKTPTRDGRHRDYDCRGGNAVLDPAAFIPLPEREGWEFLTHATRACDGPWPGQSRSEYLDSLLNVDGDANHLPLAALLRIVSQRQLHASNQAIRGRFAVVSFTAVPLVDLPDLRVFRSHRGRWDFEPYGICIRKKWLVDRGARPVLYNLETAWKELPEVDRPFFQLASSQRRPQDAAAARPRLDWTVESEWRHVGNLNLSQLEPDEAFVFVPTATDAIALQAVSPWPVCVLSTSNVETIERSSRMMT